MKNVSAIFTSKKVLGTLMGVVAVILVNFFGFTQEKVNVIMGAITVLVSLFNISQGIADAGSGGTTSAAVQVANGKTAVLVGEKKEGGV
jgi:hypothetical protein